MVPTVAPVLSLVIRPRFRELRLPESQAKMSKRTGVPEPILSQLERGLMLPRPVDMVALERGYGSPESWYAVHLEER